MGSGAMAGGVGGQRRFWRSFLKHVGEMQHQFLSCSLIRKFTLLDQQPGAYYISGIYSIRSWFSGLANILD